MNALTIIHFSQDFRKGKPQLGGYSRVLNLTKDNINQHIIFTIHYNGPEIDDFVQGHLRIVSIKVNGNGSMKSLYSKKKEIAAKIYNYINEKKIYIDLLFGHSQTLNYYILKKVNGLFNNKYKIIWELNTIGNEEKRSRNDIKTLLMNMIEKWRRKYIYKHADLLVAQTEMSKEYIQNKYSIISDKIFVCPNSVQLLSNKIVVPNFCSGNLNILCNGLFDELNGAKFMIDFFKKYRLDFCKFVFVGKGPYLDELKECASTYSNIQVFDAVPYDQMQCFLNQSNFLLIPRIDVMPCHYFIPTKLVEAMAMGVIVIGSDVKGITTVIKDKQSGFVFKADDLDSLYHILEFIKTYPSEKLNLMRQEAYLEIENGYLWSHNYRRLNERYNKLLVD